MTPLPCDTRTILIPPLSIRVTAVLISRFLLDLQSASRHRLKLRSDNPLNLSSGWMYDAAGFPGDSISFVRPLGSLGSCLDSSTDVELNSDLYTDDTAGSSTEEYEMHPRGPEEGVSLP